MEKLIELFSLGFICEEEFHIRRSELCGSSLDTNGQPSSVHLVEGPFLNSQREDMVVGGLFLNPGGPSNIGPSSLRKYMNIQMGNLVTEDDRKKVSEFQFQIEEMEGIPEVKAYFNLNNPRFLGLIIGKGGKNILALKTETSCNITLIDNEICVIGLIHNVKHVLFLMSETIRTNQIELITTYNTLLPYLYQKKFQEIIPKLAKQTNTTIKVKYNITKKQKAIKKPPPTIGQLLVEPKPGFVFKNSKKLKKEELKEFIYVLGTKEGISQCRMELDNFFAPLCHETVTVNKNVLVVLLEEHGAKIKKFKELDCIIELHPNWEGGIMNIIGKKESIDIIKKELNVLTDNIKEETLTLTSQAVVSKVVGKKGETLKKLQAETGCRMKVTLTNQLILVGTAEQVKKGKTIVKNFLKR